MKHIWNITKKYIIFIAALASLVGFAILILMWIANKDSITLGEEIRLITGLSITLSFGIGLFQFYSSVARARRQTVMGEVAKAVVEIGEIRNELKLNWNVDISSMFESAGKSGKKTQRLTEKKLEKWTKNKKDKKNSIKTLIVHYINHLERIAVGVRYDVYDMELTWDYAGSAIVRSWIVFQDFIRSERFKSNWPSFGEELEWLAEQWKGRFRSQQKRNKKMLRKLNRV